MTRVVVIMLAITMLATTAAAAAGPKVGVALSGGGARGFAHIGVLKVLEEVGMPIDVVTGTSIGSVMGGLYAAGYSAAELEQIALSQDWLLMIVQPPKRDEMNFIRKRWDQLYLVSLMLDGYKVQLPSGLRSGQELLDFLTLLTVNVHETHDFSELPIPYSCVALDIVTGEAVVLDSGSLPDAMRASMSIQSVFTPMELDGRLLVDGGMARNMPAVDALNLGADIVVGVDVSVDPMHAEDLGSLLNVATQMVLLTITENTREQSALCRTVLRPELGDMSIMDFGKIQETIDAGEAVARASIDELRALADSVIALAGPAVRPIRKEPAPVTVSGIDVEGLDMVSDHVARAELRLEPPVTATAQEIEEGITRLYHTDSFDMVRWRLDGPDDDARLRIKVTEKHENRFRFGVRFDSDIRAAVLLNVTFRNLIWRSSVLQFDLKLGDNNGVAASYVTHTGLFSALGLFASAGISQLKFDFYDDGVKIARYNANVYSARLFFGTLYSNWINLGVGGAIEQSRLAEPVALQGERDERAERVVDLRAVDVARLDVAARPEPPRARPRRSREGFVAEVVDHGLVLGRKPLAVRVHEHRGMGEVPGPLGRGQDHGQRPVRLQTVVEQTQRLADPAGLHVLLAGQLLVDHLRVGVAVGVLPEGQGDVGQVVPGRPVLVHVAAGQHADLVDGTDHAPGTRPLVDVGQALARLGPDATGPGAALSRAPRHGHLALARDHRQRRVPHGGASCPAAVAHLRKEGDVAEADVARHLDLTAVLHGEADQPVDVRRFEARIIDGAGDGLAREGQLRIGQALPEAGLCHADDGSAVLDSLGHALSVGQTVPSASR